MLPAAESSGGACALRQFVKKNARNAPFKRRETHRMFNDVLLCTNTKTPSYIQIYIPKADLSAASQNKQTAGLYIRV